MAGGRPRGSGQREGIPACPRHPTGHVVRFGTYGVPGAKRQTYRCYPTRSAPHTFTGTLARRMLLADAECDQCESHLQPFQGPPTPPRFDFTVREAATALVEVAHGISYSTAAYNAWLRGGRHEELRRQAQLAANWVETLAPIVTAPLAETTWPETIVCDSTNYFYFDPDLDSRTQAFAVLAVWGYEAGSTRGRLWALHATHTAMDRDWAELFEQLPGTPALVVCDGAPQIAKGVRMRWPQVSAHSNWSPASAEPFVFRCEHHLRANALQRMARYGLDQVPDAVAKLDKAFQSPQGWAAFRRYVSGCIGVDAWCQKLDAQVRAQASWRPRLPKHHSNGAVEAALVMMKSAIDDRHAVLRNKFRTNQLLELVRANINHQADVATFARTLRTSLEAGATTERQLSCVDRGTRTMQVNGVLVQAAVVSSLRQ